MAELTDKCKNTVPVKDPTYVFQYSLLSVKLTDRFPTGVGLAVGRLDEASGSRLYLLMAALAVLTWSIKEVTGILS